MIFTRTLKLALSLIFFSVHMTICLGQTYVNHAATGADDGTSWTDAYTDLKNAIDNTTSGEIWVAQGTYKTHATDQTVSFSMKNNVAIYGGFSGDVTETMLSERDWENNETILSGDLNDDDVVTGSGETLSITMNSENTFIVVSNDNLNNTAILDGFTVKGGNNTDSNVGGGMGNNSSSPTISNCTFTINSAISGGGMGNNINSSPILSNCTFTSNLSEGSGAGMFNNINSSPTLSNCTFASNLTEGNGAGMLNGRFCNSTITNCTFMNNYANLTGGGIFNFFNDPVISDCTFTNNSATNNGGGLRFSKGNPTISNCSFTNNSSRDGGGLYMATGGDAIITNCTFITNSAIAEGGAMVITGGSDATTTNCTFSNNSADTGIEGIFIGSTGPTFTNCIIWGNGTSNISESATVIYSIVEGDDVYPGTGNSNADPLFNDASDADGPDDIPGTADDGIRIPSSSPGAGTGDPTVTTPTTDITGATRETTPFDMGAYTASTGPMEGDLIFSEVLRNPIAVDDPFGEWFEIYNTTTADIDMQDMIIKDNGSESHTITTSLTVPAEGYIVIARNDDETVNGGVAADYEINNMTLVNSGTDALIIELDGTVIDSIGWDASFPGSGDGQSANLDPDKLTAADNDSAGNWCEPNATFGDGDKGTPGGANCCIPTVSITGASTICADGSTTLSPTTGGTWTSSDDTKATVDDSGAVTGVAAGAVTFTFTNTSGCFATTIELTINALDDASFSYGETAYCADGSDPTPTITGLPGGSFSADEGLDLDAASGAIDLDESTAGTYTITYATEGPCPNTATFDITINVLDDAAFSYDPLVYCADADDPSPTITGLAGGSFSAASDLDLNAMSGAIDLDESTAGTYTITYTTAGTCPNSATAEVTINALDDPTFSFGASTYCVDDADPTPTIDGLTGGTFSSTANIHINAMTGLIDLDMSTAGTYTITYTTNGDCPTSTNQEVTIDENCECPDNMPNTFIGMDKDFDVADNWSLGCIPALPLMGQITLMQDLDLSTANELSVGSGGSIIIAAGATLNVDVSFTVESGGSITNNGTLHNTNTITYPGIFTNEGTYSGGGTFIGSIANNGTIKL